MDVHIIQPDIIPSEKIENGLNLAYKILDMEHNKAKNESKSVTDNCDFITINNSSGELLNKSELEISTSEFIIDEDNYNISPNTSSDPCVDPLAIDEFNVEEVPSNTNDSQFSLSKDNIIYIVDVDDIKDSSLNSPTINSIKISSIEHIHNKINRDIKENEGNNINVIHGQNLQKSTGDENEMPSDGSDSGLGLDSNLLQIDNYHKIKNTITIIDKKTMLSNAVLNKMPTKSSLKRRLDNIEEPILVPTKRGKKSIQFDNVKIFYFPRIQGFCCVPSQGGCTLGMGAKHVQSKTYKLSEHVSEQNGDDKLSMQLCSSKGSSSDETDSDEDLSEENISDLDPDSSGFLQPVPVKSRRALLKAAGIKKIDSSEKDECRSIRSSREYCGCLCRGFCDPDTCSCSRNGIKCQVDRPNFPCGCTRDGCANAYGRIEFNPNRVRTHFIHTIMRLEIENKSKSTFIHDMQTTQSFFSNSNAIDVIYGGESSTAVQNSLQFFPDAVSINNTNNFDLFPLHNGEENSRIILSAENEVNVDELSHPVIKSFLVSTNNIQHNETIDSLQSSKNNTKNLFPNHEIKDNSRITLLSEGEINCDLKHSCQVLKSFPSTNKCEKTDNIESLELSKLTHKTDTNKEFSLQDGEDSSRISLSSSESELNIENEISYSFLISRNNFRQNDLSEPFKTSCVYQNNSELKNSTNIEPNFLRNYTPSYGSFSSAYANFLEEAYLPSKANFTEKIHNEISDVNNINHIEGSPVHDLLNINRNNTLPLYSTPSTEISSSKSEENATEANNSPIKELDSATKICTLAPTAHTSTSVCEGTSTTVVSNYVSSSCNLETKNMAETTTTPITSLISKCDFAEPNSTEIIIKGEENISPNEDVNIVDSKYNTKIETISPSLSPPLKAVIQATFTPILEASASDPTIMNTKSDVKIIPTI